jgi:hypothetical protein
MIATMVKHGDVAGADALILKELNTEFGGSAAAARGVLGPSADLNVEIEEMEKGFGKLITQGLKVVVPYMALKASQDRWLQVTIGCRITPLCLKLWG